MSAEHIHNFYLCLGNSPLAAALLALSFAEGPSYNGFFLAAVRGKNSQPQAGNGPPTVVLFGTWRGVVENKGRSLLIGLGVFECTIDTSLISIGPRSEYLPLASPSYWPLLLHPVETNDPSNSLGRQLPGGHSVGLH